MYTWIINGGRVMKKLSILLVSFVIFLAGCSSNGASSTSVGAQKGNKPVAETSGYVFQYKGNTIAMNGEVAPIVKALGDPQDYFEADSCAFQGKEKTYTYSGFELYTYAVDGVDYVLSINFTDDSVSTKEGISLGADLEDIKKAYGDKYTENLGLYTYEKGKSKISFMIEDNKVSSIEYKAITE